MGHSKWYVCRYDYLRMIINYVCPKWTIWQPLMNACTYTIWPIHPKPMMRCVDIKTPCCCWGSTTEPWSSPHSGGMCPRMTMHGDERSRHNMSHFTATDIPSRLNIPKMDGHPFTIPRQLRGQNWIIIVQDHDWRGNNLSVWNKNNDDRIVSLKPRSVDFWQKMVILQPPNVQTCSTKGHFQTPAYWTWRNDSTITNPHPTNECTNKMFNQGSPSHTGKSLMNKWRHLHNFILNCSTNLTHQPKTNMTQTKRHRKILRDNIYGISRPAIRRLARRGGVKRISGFIYEETRNVLAQFLRNLIQDAVVYTQHANRKTVSAQDIVYALKRQGKTIYGFGV